MRVKRRSVWPAYFAAALLLPVLFAGILGCETKHEDDDDDVLKITPSFIVVDFDDVASVAFYVTGGTPDYTWYVSDEALGEIAGAGSNGVYTLKEQDGENIVTVTDGDANSVSATVQQES